MSLCELACGRRVVGVRQVERELQRCHLRKIFLAGDAKIEKIEHVLAEAKIQDLPVERVDTMIQLGRACAITRGASVAGLVK